MTTHRVALDPSSLSLACVAAGCALMGACFGNSSPPPDAGPNDASVDGSASQDAGTADAAIADASDATIADAHGPGSDATASDGAVEGATAAAPGPGACVPTGSMLVPRSYFYSGSLQSGKVLVAGGLTTSAPAVASAEVYDPTTGTFTSTGSMSTSRTPALPNSMVPLLDGKMLIAGGHDTNCTSLSTAEIYDPVAGTWSLTGNMAYQRANAMAVRLADGRVLVSGGYAAAGLTCAGVTEAAQASAELYDPSSGAFAMTGNPLSSRAAGAVTLMSNGDVLLVDGEDYGNSPYNGTAEIYTPADGGAEGGVFSSAGSPPGPAGYTFAFPLPNGEVLVKTLGAAGIVSLYDPKSNSFTPQAADPAAAAISCSMALSSGDVFVAGGAQAEVYRAATGTWQLLGSMVVNRQICGIAELPDGNVLVVGGLDTTGTTVATAEVCNPNLAANDGG